MLWLAALTPFILLCAGQGENSTLESPYARGWGSTLDWAANYSDALTKMVKSQKPLMVIHHRENSRTSQALKNVFAGDESVQKMAGERFIMLNVVEDTGDRSLSPDGYYVPRILFVDPTNVVRTDIKGPYDDRKYTYGPNDKGLLIDNMAIASASDDEEE